MAIVTVSAQTNEDGHVTHLLADGKQVPIVTVEPDTVNGLTVTHIMVITAANYAALGAKDASTLYLIVS